MVAVVSLFQVAEVATNRYENSLPYFRNNIFFQVKGLTSGVVVCTAYLTIFLVVKIFPSLVLTIGSHGVYYLFSAISMVTFML